MAGKFEPKEPVQLNPPKDDPISPEELAAANGKKMSSKDLLDETSIPR